MFNKIIGIFKGEYKFKYSKKDLNFSKKDKAIIGLSVTLLILFFCAGFWAGSQFYSVKVNDMIQNITDSTSDYCKRLLVNDCDKYKGEEIPAACLLIAGAG